MKKIVFFSNYLNHHQMPLADAFYELLGDDYAFVATMPVEAEHLKGRPSENLIREANN